MRTAASRAKRKIIRAYGGGSHRRRRIAREIDEAARTPGSLVRYLVGGGFLLPNRKPARKRKGALG